MLEKYKRILAILGLVAFFVSCVSSFTFADDDREDRYEKQRRYDKYETKRDYDKKSRRNHRDNDDDDRDRDDDDDDVVTGPTPVPTPDPTPVPTPDPTPVPTPDPTPTPNPLCSSCHSYPGTNTLPSRHPSIGGSTPTPTPDPIPVPTPDPTPVPTPDPTPAPLDGAALYNDNCAGCHGQSNFGSNVPSSHLNGRVNMTQEEINAVNAL